MFYMKNHTQSVMDKLFPDFFLKKIKNLWIVKPKVLCNLLLLYAKLRTIETKLQTASFLLYIQLF